MDNSGPAFNVEQLEECDGLLESDTTLFRFDGKSHELTHQASLAMNEYMFATHLSVDGPRGICLRHDVDGVVWEPVLDYLQAAGGDGPIWRHVATFPALGYVAASKENRKFSVCPANASYAALCDASRHVYIYEQPQSLSTDTQVRNRKTGKQVSEVANQRVLNLVDADYIEGCQATNDALFVLTRDKIYFIQLLNEL